MSEEVVREMVVDVVQERSRAVLEAQAEAVEELVVIWRAKARLGRKQAVAVVLALLRARREIAQAAAAVERGAWGLPAQVVISRMKAEELRERQAEPGTLKVVYVNDWREAGKERFDDDYPGSGSTELADEDTAGDHRSEASS